MKYEKGSRVKRLSKENLMKEALSNIEARTNTHITNIRYGDGYWLASGGKYSVCWFNIKECKGWRFALWNTNLVNAEYYGPDYKDSELIFFCQPEITIDKFKPSRSAFKAPLKRFTMKPNDTGIWETHWTDFSVVGIIDFIKKHKYKAFYYGSFSYDVEIWETSSNYKILKEYINLHVNHYCELYGSNIKRKLIYMDIKRRANKLKNIKSMLVDSQPDSTYYLDLSLIAYPTKDCTDKDINKYEEFLEYVDRKYFKSISLYDIDTSKRFNDLYKSRHKFDKLGEIKILWEKI